MTENSHQEAPLFSVLISRGHGMLHGRKKLLSLISAAQVYLLIQRKEEKRRKFPTRTNKTHGENISKSFSNYTVLYFIGILSKEDTIISLR